MFPDLLGDELIIGSELGEDDTTVGLLAGINGEAVAPSDPGLVGLLVMLSVQFFIGDPHRFGFWVKADSGKPDKDLGISPEKLLPEMLKSWRFGRFIPEMEPENRFSSRRRVNR